MNASIPVLDMIQRSGWVARVVLILLGILSIMTWTIIINRFSYLRKVKSGNKAFRKAYAGLASIADIDKMNKTQTDCPMGILGKRGAGEFRRILDDSHALAGVRDWSFFLESQFGMVKELTDTVISELSRKLDSGVIILAISSSVAPFLGLFGTVWGIMDSFFEIGSQGSASLPVVAPGIAEALITTAIGLAVAIPSVLFYNYFVHRIDRVENEIEEFKNLLLSHLKRDLFNLLYSKKSPS